MSTYSIHLSTAEESALREATGARTPEAAVRRALKLTLQRAELRRIELAARPSAVKRVRRALGGRITVVRDEAHLRQLAGV